MLIKITQNYTSAQSCTEFLVLRIHTQNHVPLMLYVSLQLRCMGTRCLPPPATRPSRPWPRPRTRPSTTTSMHTQVKAMAKTTDTPIYHYVYAHPGTSYSFLLPILSVKFIKRLFQLYFILDGMVYTYIL